MQPTKNQIVLAELKFSYQALKKHLTVTNAKASSQFLQQLWQQTLPNSETDFYVLFVNHNYEVFSWYRLPKKEKADVYAAQIAGLAVSSCAYGVIIS